ncbi:MAG TPA: efflux RND transporter periplasmic adaptor subunit [Terriglobia bacterium]|nr:efflux RND transporter periplasmic adaptor subunit [Terriglobia bacterium]
MKVDETNNSLVEHGVDEGAAQATPPSQPSGFLKGLVVLIIAVVLVTGIVYRGIAARTKDAATLVRETQDMAVPTVLVIHPKRASNSQEVVLPANIQAYIDAPVYARTDGYLKRWLVDIGAHVKAGQLLAEIDTPEVDQQLQQARADLNTAQANFNLSQITATRYQGLLKTDAVSKQDVDNATGDFEAKKAMVASAQSNVKRLEDLQSFQKIYAPFDGVITARKTDIGALINSGNGGPAQELFHIAQVHRMRVYVNVPQTYSRAAKPGLTADLTLAEFAGRRFQGKLVRTAESIDAASRSLLVEIDVANPTGELLPGAYAEVHLKLPSGISTLMLPVNTLIFRAEGLQVASVTGGNRIALISVTLGRDFGNEVEVIAGLNGDESVVLNPPDSLVTGETVRTSPSSAEEGKGQ